MIVSSKYKNMLRGSSSAKDADRRRQKNEQLIHLVGQQAVLYDPKHPRYNDLEYKQNVWNTIGAYMDEEPMACKSRWSNIRDQYRKTLKKNYDSKSTTQYKYSELLGFLKYENEDGELRGASPSSESRYSTEYCDIGDPVETPVLKSELLINGEASRSPVSDPFEQGSSFSSPGHSSSVRKKRKLLLREPLPAPPPPSSSSPPSSSQTSNRILQEFVKRMENPDPVDAFLGGMAPTLKKLHPYYLSLAKSEIFATVQRYELKMMVDPEPVPHEN